MNRNPADSTAREQVAPAPSTQAHGATCGQLSLAVRARRVFWLVLAAIAIVLLAQAGYRRLTAGRAKQTDPAGPTPPADSGSAKIASTGSKPGASAAAPREHPIEPALRLAREGLQHIRQNIRDYTAVVTKRERSRSGKLNDPQVMFCKIRQRRVDENGKLVVPFSIYLRFLEPKSVAGREVIWVENQNDGKLIAHETGLKNWFRFKLDPNGFIAMMGQRYSIENLGLEQLIVKLLERGERERRDWSVRVEFVENVKLDGHRCTLIRVIHPEKTDSADYYMAEIFIDRKRKIPLRYAAYLWPETAGGPPVVDEEYTYRNVQLNVGLTDADFDPDNPQYDFP